MEALDRKASTMLAGTGVVLALIVNNIDQFRSAACGPRYLYYGALMSLTAALVAGVFALWPRKAKVVPSPRGLVEGYYAREHDDTLASLVATRLRAAEVNKNLAKWKVRALEAQMVLLAVGGGALVLAFVVKEWR
jgi:hypothetical protein